MKRYIKEIIIVLIQIFMFYLFPLFAGPTDIMGMVFLILLVTLILSVILVNLSKQKIKFLYPVIVAIIFLPSIIIYYNESALIHSIWYLITSVIGMILGTFINKIFNKKIKK